jgi:YidC/Oxa1 family membrane protein insertase
MSILAKPLFLLVTWFNGAFVHNFGWAIVIITIILNFVLFPLRLTNMKSMRKMQALKPQIDEINKKYKNVGLRDPKKAEQNQEVMELYKKNGVNPMGGCLPMVIQIPFLFAFYKVFTVSVEMRGASWLWVTDLSQPEHLPIKILPIVMIASQFIMQKMTPQANVDPNQQRMMMFMPLVFGFMFYNFPSGLVLYYLTSNLVNIGQQWFFNQTETAQEAARSVEPSKKKTGRK